MAVCLHEGRGSVYLVWQPGCLRQCLAHAGLNGPIVFQTWLDPGCGADHTPRWLRPTPADHDLPFEGALEDGLCVSYFFGGGFFIYVAGGFEAIPALVAG